MYLRCFTGDRPKQWLRWLPWTEYVYNTAYQSSLRDTPFRVVYGRDPPSIRSYEPGETRVVAVAKTMTAREELLADVRYRLSKLKPCRRNSMTGCTARCPMPSAIGCFYAFANELPRPCRTRPKASSSLVSSVRTASRSASTRLLSTSPCPHGASCTMWAFLRSSSASPRRYPPLPPMLHGAVTPEPEHAIRYRLARGVRQVLIHWKGQTAASATWEDVADFRDKFPHFQLEDELTVEEVRDVMYGRKYQRRRDIRRAAEHAAHAVKESATVSG
ncbi:hypothetical protein GUJ93_ZPchr0001g30062 [Zizania palustris]|uniref:Chromo domain-containing protein n=1 Tax=Zizania palustris TaxID=103762 RepID=A0A8J5VLW2_ZIZPA|nr:hypothetical protein GUJ93_ZPchr0001g30062 [Zizania palustris]